MNIDEEAVLGLLSIGHRSQATPSAATSSATLNSILTTTAPPLIPAKRKHDDHPCLPFDHEDRHKSPPETASDANDTSSEALDCICGFAVDDGFSIACDICSRWCHSACFDIMRGSVPEKFLCWKCKPRSAPEKERAVRFQRENLGLDDPKRLGGKHRRTSAAAIDGGKRKRRPSVVQPTTPQVAVPPPVEEEHVEVEEPWTQAYIHINEDIVSNDETRVKLRRQAHHWRGVTAVVDPSPPPTTIKELPPLAIQNPFLALNSNPYVLPPTYGLHTNVPIPSNNLITPYKSSITPSASYLSDPLNAYAHLGMPKPFVHLIGPPLDVALDSRLVGNYGRFVRSGCRPNAVLRPVLCDRDKNKPDSSMNTPRSFNSAQEKEDDGTTLGFGVFALRDLKANEEIVLGWEWDDGNAVHSLPALLEAPHTFPPRSPHTTFNSSPSDDDDRKTAYSPNEVTHLRNQMSNILHALSSTFTTCACGARARDCALTQMAAFVDGQTLHHTLRSQHRTGSDDEQDKEKVDLGPLVGKKRGFKTRERIPFSGGMAGMEMVPPEKEKEIGGGSKGTTWNGHQVNASAGPSGHGRAKECQPPPLPRSTLPPSSPSPSRKGKAKEVDTDGDVEMEDILPGRARSGSNGAKGRQSTPSRSLSRLLHPDDQPSKPRTPHSSELRPPDPPVLAASKDGRSPDLLTDFDLDSTPATEDRMPPKMRKKWMHREVQAKKGLGSPGSPESPGANGHLSVLGHSFGGSSGKLGLGVRFESEGVDHDEHKLMPPPPMPASLDPTTISSTDVAVVPSPQQRYQSLPYLSATSNHRLPTSTSAPCIPCSTPHAPSAPPSASSPSTLFAQFSPSPLTSFANLSLLSPALVQQALQQQQGGGSPLFPFSPLSKKVEVAEKEEVYMPQIWGPLTANLHPSSLSPTPTVCVSSPQTFSSEVSSTAKDLVHQPPPQAEATHHEDKEDVTMVDPTSPSSPSSSKVTFRKSPSQDPDSLASTPPSRNDEPLPPTIDLEAGGGSKDENCEDSHMEGVDDHDEKDIAEAPASKPSPPRSLRARSTTTSPARTHPCHRSKTPTRSLSPAPMDQDDSSADLEWANDTMKQSPKTSPDSPPPIPSSPSRSSGEEEEEESESPPPTTSSAAATTDIVVARASVDAKEAARSNEVGEEMTHPPSTVPAHEPEPETITIVIEPAAPVAPIDPASFSVSTPVSKASLLAPSPLPHSETPPSSTPALTSSPSTAPEKILTSAPAPVRQPSPPPPPKVKMSLRDFAARRKKQKEEAELSKSTHASPMSVTSALGTSPSPMIASVALAEEKGVLEKEKDPANVVNGIGAENKVNATAARAEKKEAKGTMVQVLKGGGGLGPGELKEEARNDMKVPNVVQLTMPAANGPSSAFSSSFVNGPKTEPSTLDNVMAFMPSSPIGPLIPVPHLNGYSSVSHSPAEAFIHSPPTRTMTSSPSVIGSPLLDTHKAKQELVEHHIPSLSASPVPQFLSSALLRRSSIAERSISPISPDPGLPSFSRRAFQEEDGEIGEASPLSSRLALPAKPLPTRSFAFNPPSTHSPPTGPRSFHGASASPTPTFHRPSQQPTSNSLPPVPSSSGSSTSSSINTANSRPPPPSAPRALRQSLLSNRPSGGPPPPHPASSHPHPHPYAHRDSGYIPRGPSADRDRDRDRMDWDHRHYRGPPRRGGNGWNR